MLRKDKNLAFYGFWDEEEKWGTNLRLVDSVETKQSKRTSDLAEEEIRENEL